MDPYGEIPAKLPIKDLGEILGKVHEEFLNKFHGISRDNSKRNSQKVVKNVFYISRKTFLKKTSRGISGWTLRRHVLNNLREKSPGEIAQHFLVEISLYIKKNTGQL